MLEQLIRVGAEQIYRLGESTGIDLATAAKYQNWYNEPEIEAMFGLDLGGPQIEEPIIDLLDADRREASELIRYCRPSTGRVTSPFGYRTLPEGDTDKRTFHIGIDLSRSGEIAYAVETMRIKSILPVDEDYPCRFTLRNGRYYRTAPDGRAWTPYVKAVGIHTKTWYSYKHVRPDPALRPGDLVEVGTAIGTTGNYGYSMGPHLHFETWLWHAKKKYNRSFGWSHWPWAVDPRNYLNKRLSLQEKIA